MDVTVFDAAPAAVDGALEAVLQEIARLERILSSYREDSELMQLNRQRSAEVSTELLSVIQACEQWYETSGSKFSCRMGQVMALWDAAETEQIVPERPVIRRVARDANLAQIIIDPDAGRVEMEQPISLEASGLAKGYIIDRALETLRQLLPQALAIKLDIGGDAYYWGTPPGESGWTVAVADPNRTADNQGFLTTLRLNSMAVAASGHSSRFRSIERREFSHILAPRDGWPVLDGVSAVVIAPDAETADAIATALSAQTLSEGIDWINTLDNVEALLIDSTGRQMSSDNWLAYLDQTDMNQQNPGPVLTLDYVLPEFSVANYYRPYLAIWISDTDQAVVKNLLILGETERWARENSRWWRRVGRRNPQLLDGVARPTRGPGEYRLEWDGLDDFGEAVPAGNYILHLEASREHGGHNYQTIDFVFGGDDVQGVALPADGELGNINLRVGE